jgi:exodeoxyribonuclease VIII
MAKLQGWYTDISNEEYHSGPGLSKTNLMGLLRSPAHYKAPPKDETPQMIQGEAFHVYTLQRELFDKQFFVMPRGVTRVHKEGKALVAEAEAKGKAVIPYEVFEQIKGMSDAIHAHPALAAMLSEGHAEVSGYWHHKDFPDILCKIRPDWIYTFRNLILDLKSTTDAREKPFTAISYDKSYHIQAAYYTEGAKAITEVEHEFYFAAVEREPPHGVVVYQAGQDMLIEGREKVGSALAVYHRCMEANSWPAYTTEMRLLGLPGWAKRRDMILG